MALGSGMHNIKSFFSFPETGLVGEEMTVDFPEHSNWKGVISEMETVS